MKKPIIVLWSDLGQRFYATQQYKQKDGLVEITGEKFDVTNQIAQAIVENEITFKAVKK
jgi:hypothetical protein